MESNPAAIAKLQEALRELDQKFDLSTKLAKQCSSPKWRPRVHAELTLLDKFWTQDLKFVDGDRYIGCSKPACYCCYHYIHTHPGRFVVPHSHNNNYLNWKAPDVYDAGLVKIRENIINDMAKKIRNEVTAQILERRGPARCRPDSLTEISTVRVGRLLTSSAEASLNDSGSIIGFCDDPSDARPESGQESESEDEEVGGVSLVGM